MSHHRDVPTYGRPPFPPSPPAPHPSAGVRRETAERAAGRDYYPDGTVQREWAATRVTTDSPPTVYLSAGPSPGFAWLGKTWRWIKEWVSNFVFLFFIAALEILFGWLGSRVDPSVGPGIGMLLAIAVVATIGTAQS